MLVPDLLTVLDTKELVLVVIAVLGLVPVLVSYREQSKWFAVGYGLLVVGAVATNVEALAFGDLLDVVEHGVGLMGAGITFFVAAYLRRQAVIEGEADDSPGGQGVETR